MFKKYLSLKLQLTKIILKLHGCTFVQAINMDQNCNAIELIEASSMLELLIY